MIRKLNETFLAIALGLSMGFLLALTATAKADVISKVVPNPELKKFQEDCLKIGQLSYYFQTGKLVCEAKKDDKNPPKHLPLYYN